MSKFIFFIAFLATGSSPMASNSLEYTVMIPQNTGSPHDSEQADLALCYARKAVELEPLTAKYRSYYANLLLKREKYQELVTVLQEGVSLCPNWAEGYYIWARLLKRQKKGQAALEKARMAVSLSPTIMKYRNQLVHILLSNKKILEAICVACSHPRKKFQTIAFVLANGKWGKK